MCAPKCLTLPQHLIPLQYVLRAREAEKIFSATPGQTQKTASVIAIAELVQLVFFAVQIVLYSLAFCGVISPTIAGIAILALVPGGAWATYQTYAHHKQFSRYVLTIATMFAVVVCAGLAASGIVTDSALTMSVGGIALHLFSNISEYIDSRKALQNRQYVRNILGREYLSSSRY